MITTDLKKWKWKRNYCKIHKLPSNQLWAWAEAEKAYNSKIQKNGQ